MKLNQLVDGVTPRLLFLILLLLAPVSALSFRLWYEQVRLGEDHREAIANQSIRRIRLPAVRGRILDANGEALVDNEPSYNVFFHVHEMRQPGRNSRRKTLNHVVAQIHRIELLTGRPSDTAIEWAGTDAKTANLPQKFKISEVLNWHGVVVRHDEEGYWGKSPFTNDKTRMVVDLRANTFHCLETGIRGGPVAFAAFNDPTLPEDQVIPILAERIRLLRHVRETPALPYRAFTGLTTEQLGRAQGAFPGIRGMEITTTASRVYRHGEAAAHVTGATGRQAGRDLAVAEAEKRAYATEVLGLPPDTSTEDLDDRRLATKVFFEPEITGQSGLEYRFEKELRGQPGGQLVRVNSVGFLYGESGEALSPQHGADLQLTIDARAQEIAHRLLGNQLGALVVVDVHSGAVLTMASSPAYDPARLRYDYGSLIKDETHPLSNRAVRPNYFPGSIVKPLILAIAMENNLVDPNETFVCPGYYQLGRRKIKCSHRHEPVDAVDALKHSCNSYFIDLGMKMGVSQMTPFLRTAGFGRDPEFELLPPWVPKFRFGFVPDPLAYQDFGGRPWTDHQTADASIGQGFFKCSPLQAAVMTAALANGGRVWRPYIVSDLRAGDGTLLQATRRQVAANLPVSPETFKIIHEGMAAVVWGSHGTGSPARSDVFPLAGKTGTAEAGPRGSHKKHVWFIGYGPVGAPTHAIAVMIENGASGGKTAAPIAKQFFEEYFANHALGQIGE